MSKDKEKHITKAQNALKKGKPELAIKEYECALEEDKKDVRILMKLGELYGKKEKDKALKYYLDAAKYLTKDGFYSRAVAVYKQVLQFDEGNMQTLESLGDLYNKLGLNNEAMATFSKIAEQFERDGKIVEAITIKKRTLDLDPKSVAIATKLAELYYKNGQKPEGYKAFRIALDQLQEEGKYEQYVKLLEKLAKADPDNSENLKELGEIYLDHEQWDRAYAVLARIHKNDPENADILGKFCDAAKHVGRMDEAVKLLKELATTFRNKGLRQRVKDTMRKVLEIKPDDPDALAVVGKSEPILKPTAAAPAQAAAKPEPEEVIEEMIEGPMEVLEEAEAEEEEVIIDTDAAEEIEAGEELSEDEGPAAAMSADEINEHLTEAGVYLKYGLRDKALHHLQMVLKAHPDHLKARLKLKDIYLDSGQKAKAIEEFKFICGQALKIGDGETAKSAAQDWLGIEPQSAEAKKFLAQAAKPAPPAPPAPAAKKAVAAVEEVVEEVELSEEEPVEEAAVEEAAVEEEIEEAAAEEFEVEEAAVEEEAEVEAVEETAEEAAVEEGPEEALVEEVAEEAAVEEEAAAEEAPEPAAEEVTVAAAPAPAAAEPDLTEEAEVEEEEFTVEAAEPHEAPASAAPETAEAGQEFELEPEPAAEADFSEDLQEADFYVQQGLLSEARKIYTAILAKAPGHAVSLAKLKQIEAAPPPAAKAPAPAPPPIKAPAPAPAPAPAAPPRAVAPPRAAAPPAAVIPEPPPAAIAPEPPPMMAPPPAPAPVPPAAVIAPLEPLEPAAPAFEPPPPPVMAAPLEPLEPAAPTFAPPPPPEPEPVISAPAPPAAVEPSLSIDDLGPTESAPGDASFNLQAEVASETAPAPFFTPPPPPPMADDLFGPAKDGEGLFDLAAALEDDEDTAGVAAVSADDGMADLTAFKQGVAKQISEHDSATHYDLGIAYKEMGLLDDALQEFLVSARDPARHADCMLMSAIILHEKGQLDQAVETLALALNAPKIDNKERAAIYYELGQVMAAKGERGQARWAYEQILSLDPTFPKIGEQLVGYADVAPVAVNLTVAPPPAPPAPPPIAPPRPVAAKPPAAKPPAARPPAARPPAPMPPAASGPPLPPDLPPPLEPSVHLPPPPEPPRQHAPVPPAPPAPPPVVTGPPPSREPKSWEEAALEPQADKSAEPEKPKKRKKISYV